MSVDKLSSGPACDPKKLFIEVTGLDHGSEHSIQFYDDKDAVQQELLENKLEVETLEDTCINSWDWNEQKTPINAWLAITADSGVIKLPLFTDIQAKKRVDGEQDHLLHAVMPLTLLPTYDTSLTAKERLAPVRNGYIYVFYNNKAWREIEIRTQDDGSVNLKDIDLYQYRQGRDKPFLDEKRIAVGHPLKEIWLPAKDNTKSTQIHLAYSEVQWSAQYLNHLESEKKDLTERAVAFHKLNIVDNVDVLLTPSLPKMRVREPETELFLAEPLKLCRDLSGEWLKTQYQQIKDEILLANSDGDKSLDILKHIKGYQYEYGMKQAALQQMLSPDSAAEKTWEAKSSLDYLEDAKQRSLRGVVLDDPLFDLRQRSFLAMSGIGYLQQVYVDMSKQEYYQCAELVQKFVIPKKFGKQENPFYEHKDVFDSYLGGRFHRTLRTIERQVCCRDVKELQKHVELQINLARTARVLRDITSLNDINAAAGHVIAGYGISALSIDIDKLDQLSNPENSQPSRYLEAAIKIIASGSIHPLHKVLFPPEDAVTLEDSYTPPEPFNSGSGFATTESLTLWAKGNFVIQEEQLQVMDLAFMSKANDNETGAFATERRIANLTDGIFKGYFDALMALSKDISEQAKVIQFNTAYAPVLGLLKATNSKMWGDIIYTPVGGAEFKGTVVGVHGHGLSYGLSASDREYVKTHKKKTPMGRLYDKSGKLVASTGKKSFKNSDLVSGLKGSKAENIGSKLPLKVVVVPENSAVATALNQANTQRTLQDINKKGLTASNAYEKLKIPYFIVVIEMINLKSNWKHLEGVVDSKDKLYSRANAASAIIDLGVALTHASNLYTGNASYLAQTSNKTAIKMSKGLVKVFTSQNGTVTLLSKISTLGAVSIGAGLLTAGIAGWDTIRLFKHNDTDASLAMGMVAAGTLVTTIATGLFTTSAPVLFGMGPIAWVGIGIALTGFVLYTLFKDAPIEVWLKNGPFGKSPSSDYVHLQDNTVAFNRFIGLIFSVSVKAYRLGSQTDLPEGFTHKMRNDGATHVIWFNSNLASLLNQNVVEPEFYARQGIQKNTETRSRTGISNSAEIINQSKNNVQIIGQLQTIEGYAFFIKHDIKVPQSDSEASLFSNRFYAYTFEAVFVIRARIKAADTFFPGLSLDESSERQATSDTPVFKKDEQYWLNQVVLG